jgi:hypothetical protein
MGKPSAFQKGLKRFLHHKLSTSQDIQEIDQYIDINIPWYNNLVKSLKLEDVLVITSGG